MNHPNPYRIAVSSGLLCLMVLGVFEATRAQQPSTRIITVDKPQVIFSSVPQGNAANQTIHVTSSASQQLSVDTANTASWLTVTPVLTANTAGPPAARPAHPARVCRLPSAFQSPSP